MATWTRTSPVSKQWLLLVRRSCSSLCVHGSSPSPRLCWSYEEISQQDHPTLKLLQVKPEDTVVLPATSQATAKPAELDRNRLGSTAHPG